MEITNHLCNFVYENSSLKYIIFSEGNYVVSENSYEYSLKDHLGNVRVTFTENGVLQRNDYYPFGLQIPEHSVSNYSGTYENEFLYNGKELQSDLGLNWHDYGARFYDALLGRFFSPDRFSEKYYSLSPYNYVANNPINSIDINGDSLYVVLNPNGANGAGHIAILIQNKDGKWALWSKNGAEGGAAFGTTPSDQDDEHAPDLGTATFDSPEAFMESDMNNPNGEQTYTEGFLIPTTEEQDRLAEDGVKSELYNLDGSLKDYDVLNSSCGTMVQSGLNSAGVSDGGPGILSAFVQGPVKKQIAREISKAPRLLFKRIVSQNTPKEKKHYKKRMINAINQSLNHLGNPDNHH